MATKTIPPEEEERIRQFLMEKNRKRSLDYLKFDVDFLEDDAIQELMWNGPDLLEELDQKKVYQLAAAMLYIVLILSLGRKKEHAYSIATELGLSRVARALDIDSANAKKVLEMFASLGLIDWRMYTDGIIESNRINKDVDNFAAKTTGHEIGAEITNWKKAHNG